MASSFDHVGLSVADLEAMIGFYERVFGFAVEVRFEIPPAGLRGAMLRTPDGLGLELLQRDGSIDRPAPGDPQQALLLRGPGHWALAVPDVPAAFARLTAAGAREVWSPRPAPPPAPGHMAYLADPEDNLIELVQR